MNKKIKQNYEQFIQDFDKVDFCILINFIMTKTAQEIPKSIFLISCLNYFEFEFEKQIQTVIFNQIFNNTQLPKNDYKKI